MTHTPGPWRVKPLLTPTAEDDQQGVYVVEPAARQLWKRYMNAEPDTRELDAVHAENAANARLIAAAPALLAALQRLTRWMDAELNVTRGEGVEALRQADAAIAEATKP